LPSATPTVRCSPSAEPTFRYSSSAQPTFPLIAVGSADESEPGGHPFRPLLRIRL